MPGMHTRHERFDSVIIGSSQAGDKLAIDLARAGLRVALVYGHAQQGDACVDSGCGPSRPLLASANVARVARTAADFGVETGDVAVNFGKVQLRKQAVVDRLRSKAMQVLSNTPRLTVIRGDPEFESARVVRVQELSGDAVLELQSPRIIVNTGARPALPGLPGLAAVPYLTSSSATDVDELPQHLLVLGGSYLGVEFAQMFRRFGSRVSIIERQSQLLAREDRDIAAAVAQTLREDGVEVFLETEAVGVVNDPAGGVRLKVRTPSGRHDMPGSRLLVVAGHEPNTQGLNLRAAGVAVDSNGYIRVNERLETTAVGVYALGVVNGGPAFPHVAYDDVRVIRDNILENAQATTARRTCPYTAFINPPLGRIGLTQAQAREQGRTVKVAKMPMSRTERAAELSESRGLMKVLIDSGTDRIIGAAVFGVDSAEIIGMLQVAMIADLPYTALRDSMSAHPTLVGSLNNLFAALESCKPLKMENTHEPANVPDRHQGVA